MQICIPLCNHNRSNNHQKYQKRNNQKSFHKITSKNNERNMQPRIILGCTSHEKYLGRC